MLEITWVRILIADIPHHVRETSPQILIQENAELREAIKCLNERLNEPFVTVNTVTGDLGIN